SRQPRRPGISESIVKTSLPDSDSRRATHHPSTTNQPQISLIPAKIVEPASHRVGYGTVEPSGDSKRRGEALGKLRFAFIEHGGIGGIEQERTDVGRVVGHKIEQ